MLKWILENKEWVFSGIGVALIVTIISFLRSSKENSNSIEGGVENQSVVDNSKKTISSSFLSIIHRGDENRITNFVSSDKNKGPDLRIVGILLKESESHFPKVELKFRNIGDEVVFLKKASFEVLKIGALKYPRIVHYSSYPVQETYDVFFDDNKKLTIPISHEIKPNSVDRFEFRIASSSSDPQLPKLFYFKILIIYNEDDKFIESKPIILPVPSKSKWHAMSSFGNSCDKEQERMNLRIIEEFSALDGVSSDKFKDIVRQVKSNIYDTEKHVVH